MGRLASFRAKVQLAEDFAKRITTATTRLQQAREQVGAAENTPDTVMDAAADLGALLADHKTVCVDLRSLARSMGKGFQEEIERSITAKDRKASPATLRVQTGVPLSLFDPTAWVATCTQFFDGDCAPNLDRPAKISWPVSYTHLTLPTILLV